MNMIKWAENEVELACKREAPNRKEGEFDYGCACYESALKAYKSLCEDEHSGFSWSVTKEILIKLMDSQPLTPIIEEDFIITEDSIIESPEYLMRCGLKSSIQCPRMPSLFREETLDGKVSYHDVERYVCYDINEPDLPYSGGGACNIIDELFPIILPYSGTHKRYEIWCNTFLIDKNFGDYDTKGYLYIITPGGERVEVNKFYKERDTGKVDTYSICDTNGNEKTYSHKITEWVEIDKNEYEERYKNRLQ